METFADSSLSQNQTVISEQEDEGSIFKGCIAKIKFHNATNNFAVLLVEPGENVTLRSEPSANAITLVGEMPSTVTEGSQIIARGKWATHKIFGRQFKAYSIIPTLPTSEEAIIQYLGSGIIKGFGEKLAQRVVKHLGPETLNILDNNMQRLKEVPGIGKKKLAEIAASWSRQKTFRETTIFLQEHQIPVSLAQRIFKNYGDKTIETIAHNPYLLARDIRGIGFLTADRIALSFDISPNSPFRIQAALNHVLSEAQDDGHVFLPEARLIEKTQTLLKIADTELISKEVSECVLRYQLISHDGNIYLPIMDRAEELLAKELASRLQPGYKLSQNIASSIIDQACDSVLTFHNQQQQKIIHLSEEQKSAVSLAATSPILVITGGPGCGKTTVVKTISQLFRRAGLTVKLTAPTGRASQRMSEVCDMDASTIHRLLKYDPFDHSFVHNSSNPLETDAVIVDETSMIDLPLAVSLMSALPSGCRIVFVGDADQLPSVGPGVVLSDFLAINKIPRVSLTQLFRRDELSSITSIAHQINHGEIPMIPEPNGATKTDTYFLPCETPASGAQLIERLVVDQIPKKFGFTRQDIMVLSPMNNGELGIVALNQRLQSKLVPAQQELPHIKCGNIEFRLGDCVIQRANNYQLGGSGVFNGEQGIIKGIDTVRQELRVTLWDGRDVIYSSENIFQLDLAYAITIHRSQGSEVPTVVLALHDTHNILLERQLLYTAITRAKKLLIIVGTRKAIATATQRIRSRKRYSNLVNRTLELLK
ncbi:MAG: ATP-dependent RecD-like DNA helicase [Deltaproteobacteria bacterium]|nr:ATP-dependent RecD-like DNA helicase [Deltaproteobacteria bacterium]